MKIMSDIHLNLIALFQNCASLPKVIINSISIIDIVMTIVMKHVKYIQSF